MTNIIKKGLALGLGMIATTQEQAKKIADELVKRGELSQEESKEFVKEMYEKGKETKLELEQLINTKNKRSIRGIKSSN
ncbi:phasin family protein [Bacillus pacificus]